MSATDCEQPSCETGKEAILHIIKPHEKDLGGFTVRRVLPAAICNRVGPFIFFDHMGPSTFSRGSGVDVRPHPHIGLSTLTWLYEGEILHRDSLGYEQPIQPGAVNWMTAGKGIVHSERTPDLLKATGSKLHGIQIWIALPDGKEEVEPDFQHYPTGSLPVIQTGGAELTLIAGEAYGKASPVNTHSPLFYVHADMPKGAALSLPHDVQDRAFYVVSGEITVGNEHIQKQQMITLVPHANPTIEASSDATLMLLGGAPLKSDRIVWWNFSSSDANRLEAAKQDWVNGRFPAVPGDTEFIPLPDS